MRDINGAHLEGELKEYLYDMWKNNVPHVLWNSSEPDFESDKYLNECHSILLQPLEKFICSDDNPNEYINNLQTATNSTVLCGKLFKTGEPAYTCRECASDPTCVLCNDCFQRSIHKSHRYRMVNSSGGGYCDCGDEEAWKEGAHCLTHAPMNTSDEETDPLDSLPATLRTRAIDVFAVILEYVEKHLSVELDDFPDKFFAPSDSTRAEAYCTMIFNDETHTFDSVIESLSKAIDCDHTKALHFASAIDREGRMSVKVSDRSTCAEVKRKFDRYIKVVSPHSRLRNHKPLRVSVLHRHLVAYQTFAYELLKWLRAFVVKLDGLRNLFCKLVLDLPEISGLKYLERIIINDTKLWKSVRMFWHTVFMTTFLMDRDYKKTFSSYFVKHYNRIHKEFSVDDHEHGVSISSLSVQIFTVPSISRFLIAECNALEIIIDTLTEFCVMTRPKELITSPQRSGIQDVVCSDIEYLLLNQPIWNADVYEKFFRAYDIFLNLLTSLQDMDSVVRETKSHIEHEPEWESAIKFQIAVDVVLRQLREWCSSNDELLKRCLQKAIEYLFIKEASAESAKSTRNFLKFVDITVGCHQHKCIAHVVESERVSIHQPLTRFIGGLCLHLEKHQMKITDDAFTTIKRVDRFPHYLEILMEKSLRAIVLTTQVYAGMWRRNGYSLQNQIFCYQSNRCRDEMFDKDIVMIQVVAASLHPNDFLCALINKFSLAKWFSPNYDCESHEDIQKFNISFVEDLLHLLIMIVCQRYVIGVGENVTIDAVIEEHLIHHLAIAPLTHSELIKMLSIEMRQHPRLEGVLNSITNFTRNNGKGTFALQNSMYYRFNPLSYHLLRNDLTKAEEKLLKIRSSLNETIPALMPPHLPRFSDNFKAINELFESEVFLYMIHLIFKRLLSSFGRFSSETIAFRALFLVCTGLREEEKYFKTDDSFDLSLKIQTYKPNETCDNTILSLFNKLVSSSRMDSCRDLLKYVIQLTQDLIRKKLDPSEEMETVVVPHVTEDSSVEEKLPQRNKSDIAAQRKKLLMQRMASAQKMFMERNVEFFEKLDESENNERMDCDNIQDVSLTFPITIGRNKTPGEIVAKKLTCIFCQESSEIAQPDHRPMVLVAFIQPSRFLTQERGRNIENPATFQPIYPSDSMYWGTFFSSCGHSMHSDCWSGYFDSMLRNERQRARLRRNPRRISFDIEKNEFLCPLCEVICNSVLPVVQPSVTRCTMENGVSLSYDELLDTFQVMANKDESKPLPSQLTPLLKSVSETKLHDLDLKMIKRFAKMAFTAGLSTSYNEHDSRIPIFCWNAVSTTLITLDQSLKFENKNLFGALSFKQECLSSLVELCAEIPHAFPRNVIEGHFRSMLKVIYETHPNLPALLSLNIFSLLVQLCFSVTSLGKKDGDFCSAIAGLPSLHHFFLRLCLLIYVVQVLASHAILFSRRQHKTVSPAKSEPFSDPLVISFQKIANLLGIHCSTLPSISELVTHLEVALMPFLRCCAMFFKFLTCVPHPLELEEAEDFEVLCRYLALPQDISEWLAPVINVGSDHDSPIGNLIYCWCTDYRDKVFLRGGLVVRYPIEPSFLHRLPYDFSDLINQSSTHTCRNYAKNEVRNPTICLVCGEMLCSQSYCCQTQIDNTMYGACNGHMLKCSGLSGIFFRIRDCQILLLSNLHRGAFFSPPYLDEYGETDSMLRRGNPLFLSEDSFQKLNKMWLNHSISEEVTRALESHQNYHNVEWINI